MTRTVSVSAMELLLSYSFLLVFSLYIYLRHISDAVSIEKTVIKSGSVAAGTPPLTPLDPTICTCAYMLSCTEVRQVGWPFSRGTCLYAQDNVYSVCSTVDSLGEGGAGPV